MKGPRPSTSIVASLLLGLSVFPASGASADDALPTPTDTNLREMVLPLIDAAHGRRLFVSKGCFICHAVNGIGGMAAPALDAPAGIKRLDLMGFVARMWQGAQAMLELQTLELGYQIHLDGGEIADIAAFAASSEAQRGFSIDEIPEPLQAWMIDEPYWSGNRWPDSFQQEYDKDGLPFDYR